MMMDCELPLGMIHISLILDHNMGMKYAEEPFNMPMFFGLRRPSKWVHFQTPNTHLGIFILESLPPPPGGSSPWSNLNMCLHKYLLNCQNLHRTIISYHLVHLINNMSVLL